MAAEAAPARGTAPERWLRACRREALDGGAIVPVVVAGLHLVLVRSGGRVVAAERACPHEGADLAHGRCAHGRLFCPRHRAWFDLPAGTVSPGWDFRALRIYPARIAGPDILVAVPGEAGA